MSIFYVLTYTLYVPNKTQDIFIQGVCNTLESAEQMCKNVSKNTLSFVIEGEMNKVMFDSKMLRHHEDNALCVYDHEEKINRE